MRSNAIRTAVFLLTCILIMIYGSMALLCAADTPSDHVKTVRVGWYDSDNDDMAHGYDYEYLQAIAQYTKWEYEYVPGTWDECLKRLENGEVDIMSFVHKTPEREKLFGYPELPMAITSGLLVTGSNSGIGEADSIFLNGTRVGIVAGNGYNEQFEEYRRQNGFNVNYVQFDSLSKISPALEKGLIDLAVVAEEDKTPSERIVVKLTANSQYFVTDIDNSELLRELDEAMVQVNTYCPYLNSDLYRKYFGVNSEGLPVFTSAEQRFIKTHPSIPVMYDAGWPPIEYYDESSGSYAGVSPSLFALLSEKCGISFVYEGSDSTQVLAELKNDNADNMLTTISYDYAWAQQHNVLITQPFITSSIVKLGKSLKAERPKVAVNKNAFFTYLLADELENADVLDYSKQAQRMEAVRTGEVDYTFVTEDQANYYRSMPRYENLSAEKMIGYEQKICIAVKKNSDPALLSIVSKALNSITHDEMNALIIENTVDPYKLSLSDRIYKNRMLIASCSLVLAAIFSLVLARMRVDKAKRLASEQANRAKSDFLSHVSHDIRTPLNAIIGITSLALEERDNAIRQDYLSKINESGKYLLGLINDTLDMSKIESGKMSLHYEPVNYEEICSVIRAVISPKANEKHLNFQVISDNVCDDYAMIDRLRFEQIILNLLNNAVKFTPDGGTVTFTMDTTEKTDGHIRHRITVSDNGVGMSEEYMKKLFTPFEQERNRLSVENSGTGLGLSIVKSLVDMMGGTIECKSQKGVGTQFVVEMESRLALPEEISASHVYTLPKGDEIFFGKRILLAEDNSMNTLVAVKMLEKEKLEIKSVKNGREAIDAFVAFAPGYFDAILMDIHMPVMDGLEAARAIRASGRSDSATVPIIALSANAYDEDRSECLEAGMNDHVAKPIELELLLNALKSAFQKRES